jgi:hypothetical protein
LGDDPLNLILPLDAAAARRVTGSRRWNVITGEAPADVSFETFELARLLVPAYLRDVTQRGMRLKGLWRDTRVTFVLRDLAHFVEQHHGEPSDVLGAASVIWTAGGEPIASRSPVLASY